MKKVFLPAILIVTIAACHSSAGQAGATSAADTSGLGTTGAASMARDTVKTYDAALLANTKDPSCGMTTSSGMEDTIHLGNKVIGFCSKECKAAYLKDPKSYPITYK
jgi:YHS domain-containing protein